MVRNSCKINWLDKSRTGVPQPFIIDDVFRNIGPEEDIGAAERVNIMNPLETNFPYLTLQDLNEMSVGPYNVLIAEKLISDLRKKSLAGQNLT